ncbi:MAG TPA: ankyrin repeat domain-containing protein [Bryobacteraceae bacterium]|nr:ankyrin repeat domain-containing protein [Bryobacteraceae bacterium]
MRKLGIALFGTLLTAAGLAAQDNCAYRTVEGTVGSAGPDDRTYIDTPIWAQLIFADGIASQLLVTNFDPKHSIYFSCLATGTNQYNAGNGRTGEQVGPGQTTHYPLSIYQSRSNPVRKIDVTWQYCGDPAAKQAWGAKPKLRRSNPELDAALLAALKANDADKALQLIQQGAGPDAVDPRYGYTALMLAARVNNREIVAALLQAGADVNARAKDGWTALLFSANCGDAGVSIAETILKAGADPNARHNRGYSALGILSGSSAAQMQSLLRRYGVPQ